MTVPLYEVKAKLSEYVTMAENGEVIEITKHGNTTSVIISLKEYNQLTGFNKNNYRPSFMEKLAAWRERNKEYLSDEYAESLERMRKEDNASYKDRGNPWEQ